MTVPQDAVVWRKPSFSQDEGACFEFACAGGAFVNLLRDSKNPDGPHLKLDLRVLLDDVKSGRFDS